MGNKFPNESAGAQAHQQVAEQSASPGEVIQRDVLQRLKIDQATFADAMGMSKASISRILSGKASITPETALRLEAVLGKPAEYWLKLQVADDLLKLRGDGSFTTIGLKKIDQTAQGQTVEGNDPLAAEDHIQELEARLAHVQQQLGKELDLQEDGRRFQHLMQYCVDWSPNGKDDDAVMLSFGPFNACMLRPAIDIARAEKRELLRKASLENA